MKTIKQDESISRSRFVDCPVCKNHTLKLKRTVQVGGARTAANPTRSLSSTSRPDEKLNLRPQTYLRTRRSLSQPLSQLCHLGSYPRTLLSLARRLRTLREYPT